MSLILLIVVLVLLFGGGGGDYGYRRDGGRAEASVSSGWSSLFCWSSTCSADWAECV